MKTRKIALALVLLTALVLTLSACSGSLESISIKTMPTKLAYLVGEEINLAGGTIEALYSNGNTKKLNMTDRGVSVSDFNSSKAGEVVLTVTYAKKSTTFTITVSESTQKVATSIQVINEPTKMKYEVNDKFEPDGGMLRVNYNDGSHADVPMNMTEVTFDYEFTSIGDAKVTVNYLGFSVDITVTVEGVESIAVITNPTLLTYYINDDFRPDGGVLRLTYSGGATKDIDLDNSAVSFVYDFSTKGEKNVTVRYGELSDVISVSVLLFESYSWQRINEAYEKAWLMYDEGHDTGFLYPYGLLIKEVDAISMHSALMAYFDSNYGEGYALFVERYNEIYLPSYDTATEFMDQFSKTVYEYLTIDGYYYYEEFINGTEILLELYHIVLTAEEIAEIMMLSSDAFYYFTTFTALYHGIMVDLYTDEINCYFNLIQAELFFVAYSVYEESIYLELFIDSMYTAMDLYETFTDDYFAYYFGDFYETYLEILLEVCPEPVGYDWAYLRYVIRGIYSISYINPIFYYFYNEIISETTKINACDEEVIAHFNARYGVKMENISSGMNTIFNDFFPQVFSDVGAVEFLYLLAENSYIWDYVLEHVFTSSLNEATEYMMDMYENLSDQQLAALMSMLNTDGAGNFDYYYSEISINYYKQFLTTEVALAYFTLIKADMYYRYYNATSDAQVGLEGFIRFMNVTIERYNALDESGKSTFDSLFLSLYSDYREAYYVYVPIGLEGFQKFIDECNFYVDNGGYYSVFMYFYIRLMDKVEVVLNSGDKDLVTAYNEQFAPKIALLTNIYNTFFDRNDFAELRGAKYKDFMLAYTEAAYYYWTKWWMIPHEFHNYEEMSPIIETLMELFNSFTLKERTMFTLAIHTDFMGTLIGAQIAGEVLIYGIFGFYYAQFYSFEDISIYLDIQRTEFYYGAYTYYGVTDSTGKAGVKRYMESAMAKYAVLQSADIFDSKFGALYLTCLGYYDELFPA